MTPPLILRLAGNTQAYLKVQHDGLQDKHDVRRFTYNYDNAVPFPIPWAYYKLNETADPWVSAADSVGGGGTLIEGSGPGPSWDAVEQAAKFDVTEFFADTAERYEEPQWYFKPARYEGAVAFWFKATGATSTFVTHTDLYPGEYGIYISGPPSLQIEGWCGMTWDVITNYSMGQWYFVAYAFSAEDPPFARLYLDNVLVDEDTDPEHFDKSYWDTDGFVDDYGYGFVSTGGPRGSNIFWQRELGFWMGNTLTAANVAQLWNGGAGWSPY